MSDVWKSNIDLEMLSPKDLIGIVDNLAVKLNDELEGTTPENLIGEAHREWKNDAPKFRFEVSRSGTGYNGEYRTLEEGFKSVEGYAESFPQSVINIQILPL